VIAKLTKRTIDATPAATSDVFLWDSALKGFGVKITPKNRRVFVFQYWAPNLNRVRRRMTIGPYGALTVDQAREAAQRLQGRVANREDPASELSASRAAARDETVSAISEEFLTDSEGKIKASTAAGYKWLFDKAILPTLGRKPIAQVTLKDVAALHSKHKSRPYLANRVLALVSSLLSWSETRGYRARGSNPCADIARYPEAERERFLTVDEVARLGAALTKAEKEGIPPAPEKREKPTSKEKAKHRPKSADKPVPADPFAVAAIRFLLLTGWRRNEALTLRWADVDLERGTATLPSTKTGRSHRALGAPAVALLAELERMADSPYVFPGRVTGGHLSDIQRLWTAVRHAANLSDVRLHDLRHGWASFAIGGGYSLYLTGKLLGHSRSETTARYAHLADDARKAMADNVSSVIDAALRGKKRSTPVVPITSRRA